MMWKGKAAAERQSNASKPQSLRLANLATQIKLDALTRVKKAIEDMNSGLLQMKADGIKRKGLGLEEVNQKQRQFGRNECARQDFTAKIVPFLVLQNN